MTPEQFTYWLQGYCELTGDMPPSKEQWKAIKEHLATVFHKVTPEIHLEPHKFTMPAYDPNWGKTYVTC